MRATRASSGSASVSIRVDRQARTQSRGCLRVPRPRRATTPRAQSDDHAGAGAGTAAAVTAPFHLAVPVHDLSAARAFYGELLGFPEGRSAATWVDYNMYGHQLVCHVVEGYNASTSANAVDGDPVPVPHFGLVLTQPQFQSLAAGVKAAGIEFVIEPHLRFEGMPGEQYTMFFQDPSGNALEFKAMTTPANLFARYTVE